MTLSLSILLGIVVVLMIMKWELGKFAAFVCILFGITIANTTAAGYIMGWVDQLANLISQIKF